ncbi:MAG: hypothetical protein HKP27_01195 [Myxococcales bacterium]|nr:hypothetical protein [Myxococcales bacterium]
MKTLQVFIDFKSPAAYLAYQPTRALAKELGVTVDWQPIRTNQNSIPVKQADEDVRARHRRVRAKARRETHLHYAKVQNIPMQFPEPPGCTDLALAVLAELGSCDPFVSRAFEAYWRDNMNLNEADVVQSLLEPGALDVRAMKAEHTIERRLREANQRALDLGVIDAPGYVIEGEVFVGREHLPWIRELLTDERKQYERS